MSTVNSKPVLFEGKFLESPCMLIPKLPIYLSGTLLLLSSITANIALAQRELDLDRYVEEAQKWEDDIQRFQRLNQEEVRPDDSILFVGSSSFRLWETMAHDLAPYPVIRRGFGGAKISDVLVHLPRIIGNVKFRAIVFFVGGNDVWGNDDDKTPAEILACTEKLIADVREQHPSKPIFFIEITPSPRRVDLDAKELLLNKSLRDACLAADDVHFIETRTAFLENGQRTETWFADDQLHLNRKGYELWAKLIKKRLADVLASSTGTGYFRVAEVNGKWHVLDPAGKPFFLRGVNHYGDGTHMPWVRQRYANSKAWRMSVRDRVRDWGFNYLPPSIGPSAIDPQTVEGKLTRARLVTRTPEWPAADYAELDFPFTIFLEYPRQYMAGTNLPDVFSAEFVAALDARCREICEPLKGNRNLIGYHFCHNPPWHPQVDSFDMWIESTTKPGSAGRREWVRLMQRIYGTVDRWRETYGIPIESWEDIETLDDPLRGYISRRRLLADKQAFMRLICEQWYRSYHDAIRKYDTHHLILGDRNTLHLQPLPAYAISIMSKYVDVLSVNVMGPRNTVYGVMEDATRHWDGPIHLADTGACVYSPETTRSGYPSRDLNEFETVYSDLMKMGAVHPQIVGFGWCGFYETPPPGARGGIVDVRTGDPLPERLVVIRKWNAWMAKQATVADSSHAAKELGSRP